jgi:nitrate/nitrite transporter NarK
VALAGILGIAYALACAGLSASSGDRAPAFSARDSIRALRERPVLARMALAQGFYGGGFIATAPLYALVFVDRLDLSLAEVGVIGILASVSTTVAFLVWGAVSDRFGPLVAIRLGGAIGLSSLIGYAFTPDVAVLWFAHSPRGPRAPRSTSRSPPS